MSSHTIHHSGRLRLIAELRRAGALIDSEGDARGTLLTARLRSTDRSKPIFVIAASTASFSIRRDHDIRNAILAYVWHVNDEERAETLALGFPEALAIARKMEYTDTESWRTGGYYTTTRPGKRLRELLAPYRATAARWRELLTL